jgi:transcriptional regulator with XRE-family HTH domain
MKKTPKPRARNHIGPRMREARLRCRPALSQEDLAGRLAARGVYLDRSAVSRIESSTRIVPDYELKAIAQALRVSADWLLGLTRTPLPQWK